MKTIVISIITALGSSLASVLSKLLSAAHEFFKYLNYCKKEKKEEKEKEEIKEYNDKVKDACDNGQLEDIFNL